MKRPLKPEKFFTVLISMKEDGNYQKYLNTIRK
jgi:hypothetical protein